MGKIVEKIPVRILHRVQRIRDTDEAYFYFLLRIPPEFAPIFHFLKFVKCIWDIPIIVEIPDTIYKEYVEWSKRDGRVEYDEALLDKCRGRWQAAWW